jgi:hypothetical protein
VKTNCRCGTAAQTFPAHPERRLQGPFLVATGAKTTGSTGIRHEEFVRTVRTTHPRKALLPVAAFQELCHGRRERRTPKAVALLIALVIDRLKLRIKPLDQLVKRRLPGLARMVESDALLVLAAHDEEQTLAMLSFGLEMTGELLRESNSR